MKLHWQILIALALAVLIGWLVGQDGPFPSDDFVGVFSFLGNLFIRALKMLIVPLIMSSIIVGVAGIGSSGDLGKLGGKTLLFYAVTTTLAILIGLSLVNLLKPGLINGDPAGPVLALEKSTADVVEQVGDKGAGDIIEIFVRMVPPNIVDAASKDEMLAIIFFSLLFGFFMTRIGHEHANVLLRFWQGVFQVMMHITGLVMRFAPIGVFGLVAKVVAQTGFDAARPLLVFAGTVTLALLIHTFLILPVLIRLVTRLNPWKMYPAMAPAMVTAFSTASSSATLPVTMECVERNAGVSNKISSFVLPLGATVNMNGTALYECVAAMFIAQAYGLELGFAVQFTIVVIALVTSIGVAGIPSASLVAIAIILAAIRLPMEAIGVLLVFDRVLDMMRTSVNIFGDACCAVIVAKLQGEEGLLEGGPAGKGR